MLLINAMLDTYGIFEVLVKKFIGGEKTDWVGKELTG